MSRFVPFPSSAPMLRLLLAAFGACALGCGQDVLVANWELRSLSDAGLFDETDAGSTSPQSASAEAARDNERDRDKDDDGHRSSSGNDSDYGSGNDNDRD